MAGRMECRRHRPHCAFNALTEGSRGGGGRVRRVWGAARLSLAASRAPLRARACVQIWPS
eukprot:78896-Chlamydomonas_euryale.AAC.1